MGINLYTALIMSSHAQSLCDHETHQSATRHFQTALHLQHADLLCVLAERLVRGDTNCS